jgi:hypothetical protein
VFGYDPNADGTYELNNTASFIIKSANPPVQLTLATFIKKKVDIPAYTPGSGTAPTIDIAFDITGTDITDVFLTHIHLDHAGACGRLATYGARIHVHPVGAPHLRDPEKFGKWLAGIAYRVSRGFLREGKKAEAPFQPGLPDSLAVLVSLLVGVPAAYALARLNMPILAGIRKEFEKEKPFRGLRIGTCLHLEKKTGVLLEVLMGAIRRVLGEHAWQSGAQKDVDDTRLDVSHYERLSREEIEKMVKDAEAHAADDKKRRELAEARNHLDSLIYTTEKSLKEYSDKIDASEKQNIEDAITKAKKAMESKRR